MNDRLLLATLALSCGVFGCATEPAAPGAEATKAQQRPPVYYRTGSHIPAREVTSGRDLVDDVDKQQAERDLYQRSSTPNLPNNTIPRSQPGGG
jgi:hypothetical protein